MKRKIAKRVKSSISKARNRVIAAHTDMLALLGGGVATVELYQQDLSAAAATVSLGTFAYVLGSLRERRRLEQTRENLQEDLGEIAETDPRAKFFDHVSRKYFDSVRRTTNRVSTATAFGTMGLAFSGLGPHMNESLASLCYLAAAGMGVLVVNSLEEQEGRRYDLEVMVKIAPEAQRRGVGVGYDHMMENYAVPSSVARPF